MSESAGKAVFLSYASQDAEVALRICEALRSGGVEVWLDQEGGQERRKFASSSTGSKN